MATTATTAIVPTKTEIEIETVTTDTTTSVASNPMDGKLTEAIDRACNHLGDTYAPESYMLRDGVYECMICQHETPDRLACKSFDCQIDVYLILLKRASAVKRCFGISPWVPSWDDLVLSDLADDRDAMCLCESSRDDGSDESSMASDYDIYGCHDDHSYGTCDWDYDDAEPVCPCGNVQCAHNCGTMRCGCVDVCRGKCAYDDDDCHDEDLVEAMMDKNIIAGVC
jgi:hypothetical protein